MDPDYAQAWALMALAQAELRFWHARDEDPLPAAERALSLDPKLAEAHCVKARYLEDEGRAEEAEQQIKTALKLNPNSWEANREAARMLFRHGHVREAIPFFEKAGSLVDSDWHNPMMVVGCYRSIGERETRSRPCEGCPRAHRTCDQQGPDEQPRACGWSERTWPAGRQATGKGMDAASAGV